MKQTLHRNFYFSEGWTVLTETIVLLWACYLRHVTQIPQDMSRRVVAHIIRSCQLAKLETFQPVVLFAIG